MPTDAYRVRDVVLGEDSGYVVLSRPSNGLRLYLRDANLFRQGSRARFQISGPSADEPAIDSRELRLIQSGRDWAIYSLETPGKTVLADSLRVVLPSTRADRDDVAGLGSRRVR